MPTPNTAELRRRIAALESDVRGAEAKTARITHSITSRKQTIARLRAQLDQIERGTAHATNETH